jgi:hypothetical protein
MNAVANELLLEAPNEAEVEAALKSASGADKVVIFDHTLRDRALWRSGGRCCVSP